MSKKKLNDYFLLLEKGLQERQPDVVEEQ